MRRLDPNQIREEFNLQKQKFSTAHDKSGLNAAIGHLSQAIRDLKDNGVDVELDMYGSPSEQAFDLFPPGTGGLTVPVAGLLKIGSIHRLLAVATKHNGEMCLKLGVSEYDIRYNGADATFNAPVVGKEAVKVTVESRIRSIVFDLKADPDSLVKFQTEIIIDAARNAGVAGRDAAQAFDNGDTLGKSSFKILPKP